jgi:hypothetical protein
MVPRGLAIQNLAAILIKSAHAEIGHRFATGGFLVTVRKISTVSCSLG